ncbi:hypothetical protein GCM10010873_10700 [Cypionkella aquatica]|uniref:Uncharacterized protein n=1 Tax=Cypionkella aquatica TaxID=1756042 RepID=A0AA37U5L0_9RHOB|nr:hypothetical protein [Cypionkella aquatica]GLS86096.1 hypothetical protein GCM10010873_10700 [Cypionkella aquatica]
MYGHKLTMFGGILAAALATGALAQTGVSTTPEINAPLEGANSFTQVQAQNRAQASNLTSVSVLILDEKGIWRGVGKREAADVSVAVDYKGNVIANPITTSTH